MNRVLLAVAASMLATTALAADLARAQADPTAPVYVPYNWTGFYAGANAGYGVSSGHNVNLTEENTGGAPAFERYGKISPHGGLVGLQSGYSWQTGHLVLGLEGDVQWADINDRTTGTLANSGIGTDYVVSTKSQVDWFGTLRSRVGYAFDNILLYGTGGLAFGGVKSSQEFHCCGGGWTANPDRNDTKVGYTLGAGVEYALSEHWTAKLEYDYIDLGSKTLNATELNTGVPSTFSIHTKLHTDFHTIRLGVNYKF
ncbi:outer membrane protein [Labrys okinawensis]|uniref:outer membrane protein n=1 Tax=Labrys okinawensis TaxID=346911 RepID=UPI0039BD48D1